MGGWFLPDNITFRMIEEHFEEPPIVGYCDVCGEELFAGYEGYKQDGELYCSKECILEALGVKGIHEDDAQGVCTECGVFIVYTDEMLQVERETFCSEECILKAYDVRYYENIEGAV